MNLQTVVTQLWRLVRVGGVATLAASTAATHVASGDHKVMVVAGAVAGVEVLYRALVPASEQTKLYAYYLEFKKFAASAQGQAVEKAVVAEVDSNPVYADLASAAAAGIFAADQNSAAAAKVPDSTIDKPVS